MRFARRIKWVPAGVLGLLLVAAATAGAAPSNGRAWEQVSPVDKNGYDVGATAGEVLEAQAAADGDAFFFFAVGAFGDQPSSKGLFLPYVAQREQGGWSTHGINDSPDQTLPQPLALGDDLERTLFWDAPTHWLRDNVTGTFSLLDATQGALAAGANSDLRYVLLRDYPGPVSLKQAFVDNSGAVQLRDVGVDASGTPIPAAQPGNGRNWVETVSPDGNRVVFRSFGDSIAGGPLGMSPDSGIYDVFLRDFSGATATTHWVSAPEADAPPDPTSPRHDQFWGASSDLTRIFFSSPERLTADSTSDHEKEGLFDSDSWGDLYVYDVTTGDLRDITVDNVNPEGGQFQGFAGASADGSVAYFTAFGQLGTGEGIVGEQNLFRWEDGPGNGSVRYIATLDQFDITGANETQGDSDNFLVDPARRTAAVSRDGDRIVFRSRAQLTSHDNGGHYEIYVYDAPSDTLRCATCVVEGAGNADPSFFSAVTGGLKHRVRFANEDLTRVFFTTRERLVPEDTNGKLDVYEYDVDDDRVALVSSGRSRYDSFFLDADASGDNVFFLTREALVGQDTDSLLDVYVARVGGGLPGQNPPPEQPPCDGDACQNDPAPVPDDEQPGSSEYSGPGNPVGATCAELERKVHVARRSAARYTKRASALARRARKLARKARRASGTDAVHVRAAAERARAAASSARRRARQARNRARSAMADLSACREGSSS